MGPRIVQVDAFTDRIFHGNPAAICVLDAPADEGWMRDLAAEMNLSETAFLHPEGDGYRLRWFTPVAEVDLCGHATMASAHVLWEDGHVDAGDACRFYTRSGLLVAEKCGEWIEVLFPAETVSPISPPEGLVEALGVEALYVGENRLAYCLIEVASESEVRGLEPDMRALTELPFHGYIVTSRSDSEEYEVVSRFFAPKLGIDEDPVTGSAHCVLGTFWKERLGESRFTAYQASAPGGVVRVEVVPEGVRLGGQAVTVMTGNLADM